MNWHKIWVLAALLQGILYLFDSFHINVTGLQTIDIAIMLYAIISLFPEE